nr:hypothetical protein Iba_scaffold18198CG0010 [Ipomoea batatas]
MDNLQHGVPVLLERGVGNFEAVLMEYSNDVVERSYAFQVIHEYNVDARTDIKNLDQWSTNFGRNNTRCFPLSKRNWVAGSDIVPGTVLIRGIPDHSHLQLANLKPIQLQRGIAVDLESGISNFEALLFMEYSDDAMKLRDTFQSVDQNNRHARTGIKNLYMRRLGLLSARHAVTT